MKLITLWEPWATLMAIGAKKIETRSWSTSYRGWLAIHAAKRFNVEEDVLSWNSPFREALQAGGIPAEPYRSGRRFQFSLGCIVAVARMVDCQRTLDLSPDAQELAFGNYDPGRFGLVTEGAFRLPRPIPFKSRQGMLLDVDSEIVAQIQRQWREVA